MKREISGNRLTIESGEKLDHIAAKMVIWAGGITASSLGQIIARRTNAETDKAGRLKVEPDLALPNYRDIYVIGDLAAAVDAKGKSLKGVSKVAVQGGQYAAKAILRKVRGQPEPLLFGTTTKAHLR